jgi:hypothetical protein
LIESVTGTALSPAQLQLLIGDSNMAGKAKIPSVLRLSQEVGIFNPSLGQIDFISPPSTRSAEPDIQRAPGDTKNAISSSISSGSRSGQCQLPSGSWLSPPQPSCRAAPLQCWRQERRRSVITGPGRTLSTYTPSAIGRGMAFDSTAVGSLA